MSSVVTVGADRSVSGGPTSVLAWSYTPPGHSSGLVIHLLSGWFPTVAEVVTVAVVLAAIGWRTRRWRVLWVPVAAAVGAVVAVIVYVILDARGLSPDSAPTLFWVWTVVGSAVVILTIVGIRSGRWWQHVSMAFAIVLAVFCLALSVNQWSGYYPTLDRAVAGLTAQPLPNETTVAKLVTFRNRPETVKNGRVVAIRTPSAISRFHPRTEYVYLPPAWFTGATPPPLPAVIMIGGVVNTPQDWVRSGDALAISDAYARDHGGRAPILVLVDPSGNLTTDTECVDGPRGNVDTHITDEVRPYVISHFGAASAARNWAVVGWSMGGTCAIDLVVRHPEKFATFVDISGDIGPNVGNKQSTIKALYGGDSRAWDRFDPATVMRAHGRYTDVAGWFRSEGHRSKKDGAIVSSQAEAARELSAIARSVGISTSERYSVGPHTWAFGAQSFAEALPWLHNRIDPGTVG
ncbi:alpha/beta hydrolase [Williamsia sp. Leaf354]|uniref:alpha/beta hydrolase n=1 Tax=Williamsia sp. Leaf354 TaxID=1736349 RepID=UPI001EEC3569|nr:alpha/beta hydrolase-fold protein [Williamsia sp. Leaf354]